ncbi:hypothetical protein [Aquipuribacter sp. MA13-6]|uniref:hypothetical protein n=1 Tax=unclassified Aquipuribacter TaxID=2635084 RepID=UPI003EEEC0D4
MSGVTLTATALAGMVLGCAAVGGVGQVAVVRARVDAAADLAALAAAAHLARGDPVDLACAAAAQVAAGAGGAGAGSGGAGSGGAGPPQVVECLAVGPDITVRVVAPVQVLGLSASVEGRARAGPVSSG